MNEDELLDHLKAQETAATGYFNDEIANAQETAQKYYNGEFFGNEEEGRSQVISKDVAQTIDCMMPELIKLFVSGDNVVEFEAENEEDEQYIDLATNYVNHIFYKDNKGFDNLYDWAKDGLQNKLGIIKTYWTVEEVNRREQFENQPEAAYMALDADEDVEITELSEVEENPGFYNISILRKAEKARVKIEVLPPEEFLIAANSRNLHEAPYLAHRTYKTVSELIEMGFDEQVVLNLSTGSDSQIDGRTNERFSDEDYYLNRDNAVDPMMRQVQFIEEYVKIDFDGDKNAEMRKVSRCDKEILENVMVSDHPFVEFCPTRIPHKVYGKSVADDTQDIQLIKSTLLRQTMDNIYQSNAPRYEVPDAAICENTFDDLLSVRVGAPIRTAVGGQLREITLPFTANQTFNMLEYWDAEKEQRTGVTRYNQGLDADTLNHTATGVELIQNASMGKIELVARGLSNKLGELFQKILKIIIDNQADPRNIKINGNWQQILPKNWNQNLGVKVTVGLGTGDKSKRIMSRMKVLEFQMEGKAEGLVQYNHIYNNLRGLVRDMELGNVDKYFPTIEEAKQIKAQAQPQKSPEQQKLEAEMQFKQQELQFNQQSKAQDMQMRQAEAQADQQRKQQEFGSNMQMKKVEMEQKAALERDKLDRADALKRFQIEQEFKLKREQMAIEANLKVKQMELEAALKAAEASNDDHDDDVEGVRMGGDVG